MISQDDRLGKLHAPGTDLALMAFSGREGINMIGGFEVDCLLPTGQLDADDVLGRNLWVEMRTIDPAHPARMFDGVLCEVRELGPVWGGAGYALVLRPWLWLLGLRTNQRIFHEQTPLQILEAIFAEYGFPHDSLLQGSYPVLEYTVQYDETDLAFATRLMAHYGINYCFRYEGGTHRVVLFDEVDSLPEVPGTTRPIRATDRQYRDQLEHLHSWRVGRKVTTGRVALTDYNFTAPRSAMLAEQADSAGHPFDDIESFQFPGRYPDQGAGRSLAQLRLNQARAADGRHRAQGDSLGLAAGLRMTLRDHPDPAIDGRSYLVTQAEHKYVSEGYRTGDGGTADRDSYQGVFEFLDTDRPMVPDAAPAAPRVQGPQTAIVVGEGEIDCDEYGRILVLFHWDRDTAKSMRCRVAQSSAGNGWGSMIVPRVGMEVVVEFIGGDPACPLVTGCVYNAENMPPFDLPGANMVMGMKSNSTPGGDGYNELVFDDTAGKEGVRLHAQYDLTAKVLHDQTWHVLNDRATQIDNNDSLKVKGTRDSQISGHDTLDVGRELTITAAEKITLKVGMSSIVMDGSSITLKSPTVEVKAGMEFKSEAGMMSQHKAGAVYDIKGAVVKINT
ncbi:Actin cross-linking toxin VgrG1 [Roseibaca ekhonensis]|uniref:Actin cross-linking toxin VgrG1 n=1 Tax=Roseinatronobacter ekhonensis TaxID=254356 RepID=A0A3B0MRS9_9RHOB|nr:type VI secretion system tip protein TssI/VgrG [Roseibaca ekhonensis]SUZ32329.1 Actin cross-linking toxin VgrG1 [Roseibaca ekhonensis]